MSQFRDKLEEGWRHHNWLTRVLLPVSLLYRCVMSIRTGMYRMGLLPGRQVAVPVVVVGNLTVGGTGKTPLVIHLAGLLKREGWNPGIISRGYLGRAANWPREVHTDSNPAEVGDEAVVLAARSECPVVVGPSRLADADMLLENSTVDILLSDDGLQHYALKRQVEIAIVPEESAGSNRSMLPAGPYRETAARLEKVDLVLQRGAGGMELRLGDPVSIDGSGVVFEPRGPVHAVAGIARPSTFFELLRARGLDVIEHDFPDHHHFEMADLEFGDDLPILMTEKDAVKCRRFAGQGCWMVPATAEPGANFDKQFLELLSEMGKTKTT